MTAKQINKLAADALKAGYTIANNPDRRIGYTTNHYTVRSPSGHYLNTYGTEIQAKRFLAAFYRKVA